MVDNKEARYCYQALSKRRRQVQRPPFSSDEWTDITNLMESNNQNNLDESVVKVPQHMHFINDVIAFHQEQADVAIDTWDFFNHIWRFLRKHF